MIKALTQACKPWMIVRRAEKDVGLPFCWKCPAEKKFDIICRFDYFSARNWQFYGIDFRNTLRKLCSHNFCSFLLQQRKENHCKLVASYDRCVFSAAVAVAFAAIVDFIRFGAVFIRCRLFMGMECIMCVCVGEIVQMY